MYCTCTPHDKNCELGHAARNVDPPRERKQLADEAVEIAVAHLEEARKEENKILKNLEKP